MPKKYLFKEGSYFVFREDEWKDLVTSDMDARAWMVAKSMAGMVKSTVPKGTTVRAGTAKHSWKRRSPGTLRSTVGYARSKYRRKAEWVVFMGSFHAYYARWVELGTPGTSFRKNTTQLGAKWLGKPRRPQKGKKAMIGAVNRFKVAL